MPLDTSRRPGSGCGRFVPAASNSIWPPIENAAGGTGSVTRINNEEAGEGPLSLTLIYRSKPINQSTHLTPKPTHLAPPCNIRHNTGSGSHAAFLSFNPSRNRPTDHPRCVRPSPSSSPRWRAPPRPPCSGARATTSTSSRRCVVLGAFRDAVVDAGVGSMLAGVVGFGRGEGVGREQLLLVGVV